MARLAIKREAWEGKNGKGIIIVIFDIYYNLELYYRAYAQQDCAIVKMRTMMEDDTQNKHKAMTTSMRDYNAQLALEKANK